MKIHIAAVGRLKDDVIVSLYQSYLKRINWSVSLSEVDVKKSLPEKQRKVQEGQLLLSAVPKGYYKIVLDETGREYSSHKFAKIIESRHDDAQNIAFFIGGAYGHAHELRQQADLVLSFGLMTWPHKFVRVMLAEQLYRSYSILTGHPYHK